MICLHVHAIVRKNQKDMNLQGREFGICQSLKQSLEVLLSMLCMLWNKSSKRLFYIFSPNTLRKLLYLELVAAYNLEVIMPKYMRETLGTQKIIVKKIEQVHNESLNLAVFFIFDDDPIPEMCPFVTPR